MVTRAKQEVGIEKEWKDGTRGQSVKGGERIEEERVDRSVRLPFPSLGFAGLISGSPETHTCMREHAHAHNRIPTDRQRVCERV